MFGARKELVPERIGLELIEAENLVQLFSLAFLTERRLVRAFSDPMASRFPAPDRIPLRRTALRVDSGGRHAVRSAFRPSTACAAASRAIGTRKGEQDT